MKHRRENRRAPQTHPSASAVPSYHRTMLTDRKSTRLNSSHSQISYAVFCLKKKIVLAPDPGSIVAIAPGLDRYAVAGRQGFRLSARHQRRLVSLLAEPMAEPAAQVAG